MARAISEIKPGMISLPDGTTLVTDPKRAGEKRLRGFANEMIAQGRTVIVACSKTGSKRIFDLRGLDEEQPMVMADFYTGFMNLLRKSDSALGLPPEE